MGLTILLPLDKSRCAQAAQKVALQLAAARPGSQVVALHVVNLKPGSGNFLEDLPGRLGFEPAVVPGEIARDARKEGQALLDAAIAAGREAGVAVEGTLEVGPVARTILRHSRLADLVIMGLRGETEERFAGQGGEMIAWLPARLSTPFMMLPQGVERLERVAIGYDGSLSAQHALRAARTVLNGTDMPVDALYVSRDGSGGEVLDEVVEALPERTVTKHVVKGADPHTALVQEAGKLGVSVLALGFRGKNKLKDFLFGTTTERIAIQGSLGVLVAH